MNYGRKDIWIASLVAFVAWGLAVQQLPILRFLGYAFNLGLFSAIAIVAILSLTTARPIAFSSESRPPIPALVSPASWQREISRYRRAQAYSPAQLYPESFLVSQALDGLVSNLLQEFVLSWYTNISKRPAFVNTIDQEIRNALTNIKDRIQKEDLPTLLIARIIPHLTAHFKNFEQAEKIVRGRLLNHNVTESEELDLAIAAKYKDGKLHPAASLAFSDSKVAQQEYLRKLVVRILPDVASNDLTRSRAVSVLVEEIVTCAVLYPVLQLMADPDTWNQIIEAYGRTALQDRKTVKQMRAALDQHASPVSKRQIQSELPRLSPHDSERAFEKFVRAVRKVKTISDARRYRSQISSQLAKASTVENQDPIYLRRLEMARRVLEQKIARLAHTDHSVMSTSDIADARNERSSRPRELSLAEILHTVSGLSSFMEFMDRQRKMSLVQFWIVVDGFRNPLEDDFGDDGVGSTAQTWTDTDRLDIAQISEAYISKPELKVPQESQDAIRAFLLAGRQATPGQYRAARIAILSAQSAVLEELDSQYSPLFRKSDLYFSFLASDEANAKAVRPYSDLDHEDHIVTSMRPSSTAMSRSTSQQPLPKRNDLRRAALSSSDVTNLAGVRPSQTKNSDRSSLDSSERPPLFEDGYDTDPLASSTHSIGQETHQGSAAVPNDQVIEDMETALTNIMANEAHDDPLEDEHDALFKDDLPEEPEDPFLSSGPGSNDGRKLQAFDLDKSRPSLATLGLVNTSSRIGVFSDNDLFSDEEKFPEDEYADQELEKTSPEDEIHAAAPGDLGLAEAITVLTNDIERLISQESVVDTLTRKAELTNNVTELRILGKSKASLQREIRRKELQRQQYIVQESDNSLYGRSRIRIKSVVVGKEDDGREFALYVIEVQRQAGDQMPAAIWAIARRYSAFHDLHQRLRQRYPSTRQLEFPRRRMVMKLQKQFLQNRRTALEAYLQQLLRMPDVCRSHELRSFLSQQAVISDSQMNHVSDTQDLVSRIYNSVTDGMDEFLGNIAVLDQLSAAGQNLISAATGQGMTSQGEVISIEPGSVEEAEAELRAFEDKELEPFVKPICDIFLEVFGLNRGNNWLRGRAVVVVLHQLLGGTIERKVRETFRGLGREEVLIKYIDQIKDNIWPAELGGARKQSAPRATVDKERSRKEAGLVLSNLIPDLAGSVVGRTNAQGAARRIMATLNNKRLNEHLVMTIFDEVIGVLFGNPEGHGKSVGTAT